jgi:hypothetical protein
VSKQTYGARAPAAGGLRSLRALVCRDVGRVRSDIEHGKDSGQLSRKQARRLKQEAGEIRMLQERYARDGLSDQEQAELRNRVEVLKAITNAKKIGRIK